MNANKQVEDAIYYAALSVSDPAQRGSFLDRACAGNQELRATVEEMLTAHGEAEQFFAKGRCAIQLEPGEVAPLLSNEQKEAPPEDQEIGTVVGNYKLLQRIGEGGCGVIYMAEQEKPVQRRVAVKVIKPGMDTRAVIARFEAERQALSLMDHPHIARVLDAGTTALGRPYFVMELVRGVKITDYCDRNNLETRDRLRLFIQICHAVQHAHQKGVIHRDIKPSNILVTMHDGVAVPKVIDFGIAKATEGKLTDQTMFTAYEQLLGTPAYMSPEQAEISGLDVDTRSDIYSLGVLLYELLTGRTPFDGKELMRSGVDELRRTLREKEPQRPSMILTTLHGTDLNLTASRRHAEPPRLISLLKGDIDWIVMKALEKDRSRRYETANGLAMDVQRYLNNEPVVARPPSRLYRFQKLVRRNKAVFVAGGAVAVALIVGLGAATSLYLREQEARHEQALLREQAEKAEQREAELRRQAEAKEKINQAAIYVTQNRFEDANRLLEEVKNVPSKPSFDGVASYRRVGEWLAVQQRWREAANRFYPLMEIDKLDEWQVVTLDYQACGVVLAECKDAERYEIFRDAAIERFSSKTNADMAGRILKTCLLIPPDKQTLERLAPMGEMVDRHFSELPQDKFPNWAAIHTALWEYRRGDLEKAREWCVRVTNAERIPALRVTLQTIVAMCDFQEGNPQSALKELAAADEVVAGHFKAGVERGNAGDGFWYDWLFARILLNEAKALINAPAAGQDDSVKSMQ